MLPSAVNKSIHEAREMLQVSSHTEAEELTAVTIALRQSTCIAAKVTLQSVGSQTVDTAVEDFDMVALAQAAYRLTINGVHAQRRFTLMSSCRQAYLSQVEVATACQLSGTNSSSAHNKLNVETPFTASTDFGSHDIEKAATSCSREMESFVDWVQLQAGTAFAAATGVLEASHAVWLAECAETEREDLQPDGRKGW